MGYFTALSQFMQTVAILLGTHSRQNFVTVMQNFAARVQDFVAVKQQEALRMAVPSAVGNPYMTLSRLRKEEQPLSVEQLAKQAAVLEAAVKMAGGKKAWKKLGWVEQWRFERHIKQQEAEEKLLVKDCEKWLRRRAYETGHFDRVIVNYREVSSPSLAFPTPSLTFSALLATLPASSSTIERCA